MCLNLEMFNPHQGRNISHAKIILPDRITVAAVVDNEVATVVAIAVEIEADNVVDTVEIGETAAMIVVVAVVTMKAMVNHLSVLTIIRNAC